MNRFGLSPEEQEQVWELWAAGRSLRGVARELGHGPQQVRRYVWSTGGRRPKPRRRAAVQLSEAEREEISRGLASGQSYRQIGRELGRSHSTIVREVQRNGGRERYRGAVAEVACWDRARRPKVAKLAANPRLRAIVEERLAMRWSPEQIAAWLARAYAGESAMQVSHETIYLSLFVQSRGALRRDLALQLRSGRSCRRPRGSVRGRNGRGHLRDRLSISERPAEVADRMVPGHWEGDLLVGRLPTAIITLVERSSRYTVLVALPDGRRSGPVRAALASSIAALPDELRRSLTWDQGKEMAEHALLTIESGMPVYFCDAQSPWQRGTNENTNGLLRQYFPRKTTISARQDQLDAVAAELNARPRKTLDWMTPAEKLAELLNADD